MEVWVSGIFIPLIMGIAFMVFDKEVKAIATIIRSKPFEAIVIVCLVTIITMLTVYIV